MSAIIWVVQMTPETAEAHTRRTHSIPPDVGLGWVPYNYIVTLDSCSWWACHTEIDFNRRSEAYGIRVVEWSEWEDGSRIARMERTR